MRMQSWFGKWTIVLAVALLVGGCAAMTPQPTADTFKAPEVTLDSMEVAHYWGWWFFAKTVQPTKGTAGDYGAPLDLAFVFNVHNPNTFPVMLESLKFTVAFEDFDLNSLNSAETQWIPPGKTNQVRVHGMFDGQQSRLNLMLVGGQKLKEKGVDAFTQLEKWWTTIGEGKFPVNVKEGAAVFKADGLVRVSTFKGAYPAP